MERHHYHVDVKWTSGRMGTICSREIEASAGERGCFETATPPPFNGGVTGMWSPEHLYTAAVNSCFMTTFLAIAENSRLVFTSFSCRATGVLELVEKRYLMTEVLLEPVLSIEQAADREKALRILQKAEQACLISNSIRSNVRMTPWIRETTADLKQTG